MRYQETHREETRRRLISQASIRLRRDGLNAVGLRTLVADAGVTHGAFYAHFSSKSKLVEAAIEEALNETCQLLAEEVRHAAPDNQLEAFVSAYLSEQHWKSLDHGCIVAALAPEIAREDAALRQALTRGSEPIFSLLQNLLPSGGDSASRAARAATIFAGMVGALQLARLHKDPETVKPMLAAARGNAMVAAAQTWT
ncbi:TetR/AcrR family transcriptional regulator [Arenicella chitinivorans]|uniref:TetR/AcrR family transcriptional regulator n=1 Tax=Arenicella chitinivorans TaxID=1329800 RepID=UPI001679C52A|nr:TetR/AcrR family transcriptional regulator [Arenicella chitinivorans]